MNVRKVKLVVCSAAVLGLGIASEDAPPEHQKWMKDLGNNVGAIRKRVDMEKNARDMQATLKEVAGWCKNRTSEVALKSSTDATDGAEQIAKAAQAGDQTGIAAGMKALNAGCKGCHDVHREKVSDTVYRIK